MGVPESSEWVEEVYELQTTDPALGGPGGIANRPLEHLASRTRWLRDQLDTTVELLAQAAAAVRPVIITDQHDRPHHMVWVPRFRVPAGLIGDWPSEPVEYGGFFVDQYAASHPDATATERGIGTNPTVTPDTAVRACSTAGVVPWTNINLENARVASANRVMRGRACRLIGPEHWAAIQLLSLANAHPRGNTAGGRDVRDANEWPSFGVSDPVQEGRTLVGTGPKSWAHNGQPTGVVDWLGNVHCMLDMQCNGSRYLHWLPGKLDDDDGISAGDTAMVVSGLRTPHLWPSSGVVAIMSNPIEYVAYSSITDNADGTWTLSGLTRGQLGTTAAAHDDGVAIRLRTDWCLLPTGASAFLTASINDTDDPVAVQYERMVAGPGAPGTGFGVGREIQIGNEVLQITNVVSSGATGTLTCERGSAAAHDAGDHIAQLYDGVHIGGVYATLYIAAFRDEPMLRRLCLPAAGAATPVAPIADLFTVNPVHWPTPPVFARGGAGGGGVWTHEAVRGWRIAQPVLGGGSPWIGFRAVLEVEDV